MDIDAIKSRLNQLQNTTSNNFWKPQPGKSQVRIVPYTHDKNNPFSELFFVNNIIVYIYMCFPFVVFCMLFVVAFYVLCLWSCFCFIIV